MRRVARSAGRGICCSDATEPQTPVREADRAPKTLVWPTGALSPPFVLLALHTSHSRARRSDDEPSHCAAVKSLSALQLLAYGRRNWRRVALRHVAAPLLQTSDDILPGQPAPVPPKAPPRWPMIAPSDDPEAPLLYAAASASIGHAEWASRAVASMRPLDWNRLVALAMLENAVTLLDARLRHSPSARVPPEVRERVRSLALAWRLKLRLLERRLADSVRALDRVGIRVTLLKGAALAHTVYPSFDERPMADLDLLVDPDRAGEAHLLMQRHGWTLESAGYSANAWSLHHHLPPLADCGGSGLRLEIHQTPLPPGHRFRLDRAMLNESVRAITIGGTRVQVPEPHLHAVHACVHFAWSHQFESGGLAVFRDLAMLRAAGAIDWAQLVEVAKNVRAEACCYWTLRLAHALIALEVPDSVLRALAPELSDRVLSMLERHLSQLVLRTRHSCPSVVLRQRLWALALGSPSTGSEGAPPRDWNEAAAIGTSRHRAGLGTVQRLGRHMRRVPRWSQYFVSLIVAAAQGSS